MHSALNRIAPRVGLKLPLFFDHSSPVPDPGSFISGRSGIPALAGITDNVKI